MRLFNRKQKKVKDGWPGEKNRRWWDEVKKKVKGMFVNIVIDESDPEYDAQKIYQHWLNSFK